jgi:hypothetical protein
MTKKRVLPGCMAAVAVLGTIWVAFNPPGRFGYHRFGLSPISGWKLQQIPTSGGCAT